MGKFVISVYTTDAFDKKDVSVAVLSTIEMLIEMVNPEGKPELLVFKKDPNTKTLRELCGFLGISLTEFGETSYRNGEEHKHEQMQMILMSDMILYQNGAKEDFMRVNARHFDKVLIPLEIKGYANKVKDIQGLSFRVKKSLEDFG